MTIFTDTTYHLFMKVSMYFANTITFSCQLYTNNASIIIIFTTFYVSLSFELFYCCRNCSIS